ncbi:MAG: ribulose-phosphate 3-epimerase [Bacteroidota bacterium]
MYKRITISASLACANFRNLEKDIRLLEESGVEYIHVDVMDGLFVPNFCLDLSIVEIVKSMTDIPVECHLMIQNPERYIDKLASYKPEYISIHYEATNHAQRALNQIKSHNIKAGIALVPATPLSCLDYIIDDIDMLVIMTVNPGFAGQKIIPATIGKIRDANDLFHKYNRNNIEIQVDGNVSFANIPAMLDAGATMLVGGTSSLFSKDYSISEAVTEIRKLIKHDIIV